MPKSFTITLMFILLLPLVSIATLQPLENAELADVTGQSGIIFAVKDVQIFQNIEYFRYCASDNGYLLLNNLQSDVIKYNFGTENLAAGLMYMDAGVNEVASLDDWNLSTNPTSVQKGMYGVAAPNWVQEVSYQAGGFLFSDGTSAYDLGEFWLGQIRQPSWKYFMAPHEGGTGVDFEYDFEMHIDALAYVYGTDSSNNCLVLGFEDIHIGRSFGFGTAGDDPADPTTWTSDIGEFQVGDMFGDLAANEHARPAQIDAGVCNFDFCDDPLGAYRLRLPFEGSFRFENAEFGGTDFGPGAIDGINAYRFDVYLFPAVP